LSEDQKIGEASVEAAQGYTSMSDAYAPPEEKRKTYNAEEGGIREAAEDLNKARASTEAEPIPRTYVEHGGDHHGEAVPENQTLSLERASDDLTRQRAVEQAAQQPDPVEVANAIDNARAQATQQQPQPQPEPQAQPQQTDQAQTTEQQHPDIDPEIAQALNNPKIRAALEAEVQAAEQARAQFAQQARAVAQLSAASLFSQWPALASLTTAELPHALSALAKTDPAQAAAIQAGLSRTEQLYKASVQAEAQRTATQQQQLAAWVSQQDDIFEKEVAAKHSSEQMNRIAESVVELAEEYGVSREELFSAWKSQPVLRSAAFQRLMVDAAKYRMAQKAVPAKVARPVPPVQRPGIAPPHGSNNDVDQAISRFRSSPSVDTAVQLIMSRRASNRR
jgi:hypothetical protein